MNVDVGYFAWKIRHNIHNELTIAYIKLSRNIIISCFLYQSVDKSTLHVEYIRVNLTLYCRGPVWTIYRFTFTCVTIIFNYDSVVVQYKI